MKRRFQKIPRRKMNPFPPRRRLVVGAVVVSIVKVGVSLPFPLCVSSIVYACIRPRREERGERSEREEKGSPAVPSDRHCLPPNSAME